MPKQTYNFRDLQIGDLVTHVLYGPEWIGMIISISDEEGETDSRIKALVQIQPGTKYDGFFDKNTSKQNKINSNLGFVSINWLFKVEKRKR
tara:strand:+ start:24268 stop:24540 length:273 start_codon:yes stop_codon:yes gene_type:complete